jgi:hypothetical protein
MIILPKRFNMFARRAGFYPPGSKIKWLSGVGNFRQHKGTRISHLNSIQAVAHSKDIEVTELIEGFGSLKSHWYEPCRWQRKRRLYVSRL